ncbi:DUF4270 family protein [Brumimicrobium aurantiacum]|nr:DUF4270 family protein [Brumimicrobium aurantiacum]
MTRIKNNKLRTWREISIFFAAFFCLSIAFTSCKKKRSAVGSDALSSETLMNSKGVDTFQLKTSTVEQDSIFSMDPAFNLIGSYNDEVFGTVDANFYTQLTLSGFSPDFGDLTQITIDSAVMAFEYGGYYGDLNEQLFEVYEIQDELTRDSSYLRTSTTNVFSQNLVPTLNNEGLITPDTESMTVVGDDTLDPQLRIPLDTNFARDLLGYAQNASTDEDFLQSFKGLHFKVNNSMNSPGEGSIVYLASSEAASKLTVYYTKNGESSFYDFIINGSAVDYNHVDTDFTGTKVEQVINDPTLGQTEYYVQAFSTLAKVEFSSIDSLPDNIIIHEATLELPVNYYLGSNYYPSTTINVSADALSDGDKYLIKTSGVQYNSSSKSYQIDLRDYIQLVLQGDVPNTGIFISPRNYITTAERIILNGVNTMNKNKPKLSIVYTVL